MKKFDGILFCTDVDGTLLRSDGTLSEENIKAIEYFKSEGGIFTFITGRMPFFAGRIYNAIKPNAPFGCVNGGAIYDHIKQEYVWTYPMQDGVTELIECIDKKFPDVGIQINTFYNTFFCKDNVVMQSFRKGTGLENLTCDYKNVT